MKKENTLLVGLAMTAAITAVTYAILVAPGFLTDSGLNMTEGVTNSSKAVYDLHMIILWICIVIGILVFAAMFTSIFLHRKSRGAVAAKFDHSTKAEIIWTTIPILILIVMAVPSTITLIELEDNSNPDIIIKITGYQWKWKYDYIDEGISFYSSLKADSNAARMTGASIDPTTVDNYLLDVDNRIVIPVGKKIGFLITADDVIHSWWVPALGWKQDAVPGFINQAWTRVNEVGVYRGQCAELCGRGHGFMPIVLEAKSEEDYAAWLVEKKRGLAVTETETQRIWSKTELMAKGEAVYAQQCAGCHQTDGQGLAPAFPAMAGNPVTNGSVSKHIDIVMNGSEGTAMQAFSKTLTNAEIAAALTYTRNAFGNQTGDLIQPATIAKHNNG
ncbi:MAG: cytochrome c oxidase subunit II [Xanthomonadales bacterium]|nr:cytochrome c oxidase subunit II [Xanthomonadales bacterium]